MNLNTNTFYSRFEVETLLTNTTKWDGVGFRINDDKQIGYCMVKFSGGIKKNCLEKKVGRDEEKIETGILKFMDFTNADKGHFIRFHRKVSLYLKSRLN